MPGLGEVLALHAPPPGGIVGPLPTSQLMPEEAEVLEVDNAEKVKPASVATQTRKIGMVHPPPDVRSIVDKTAQFVARIGPEFEKRVLAHEKGNVKFNFLKSDDLYHAYYQHRVTEFRTQLQAPAQTPGVASAATGSAAQNPQEGGAAAAPKEVEVTKADNKGFGSTRTGTIHSETTGGFNVTGLGCNQSDSAIRCSEWQEFPQWAHE